MSKAAAAPVDKQMQWLSPLCPPPLQRNNLSIEDFDVIKRLGSGYRSQVLHVRDKPTGFEFALKVYVKNKLNDVQKTQVRREIGIQGHIQHDNVVALFGAFEDQEHLCVLLELAQGDLYKELRKKGRFPEGAAKAIVQQLLIGLDALHTDHIMHRDLKPENIMIWQNGKLKLGDFGLAIDFDLERPVTRAGTLQFISPEVLMQPDKEFAQENKNMEGYTSAADIFSLGVLAFELLVGDNPFKAPNGSKRETMMNILNAEPVFPAEYVSNEARVFLSACLLKDPGQRPTARELLNHSWLSANTISRVGFATRNHRFSVDSMLQEQKEALATFKSKATGVTADDSAVNNMSRSNGNARNPSAVGAHPSLVTLNLGAVVNKPHANRSNVTPASVIPIGGGGVMNTLRPLLQAVNPSSQVQSSVDASQTQGKVSLVEMRPKSPTPLPRPERAGMVIGATTFAPVHAHPAMLPAVAQARQPINPEAANQAKSLPATVADRTASTSNNNSAQTTPVRRQSISTVVPMPGARASLTGAPPTTIASTLALNPNGYKTATSQQGSSMVGQQIALGSNSKGSKPNANNTPSTMPPANAVTGSNRLHLKFATVTDSSNTVQSSIGGTNNSASLQSVGALSSSGGDDGSSMHGPKLYKQAKSWGKPAEPKKLKRDAIVDSASGAHGIGMTPAPAAPSKVKQGAAFDDVEVRRNAFGKLLGKFFNSKPKAVAPSM